MANLFERIVRGVEAARGAMGSDAIAETNRFDLAYSGYFPTAKVRRRRDGGEIVVEVGVADAYAVMTVPEFDRFVTELSAFREVAHAAVEAARRTKEG
jgi:hypothetical protein